MPEHFEDFDSAPWAQAILQDPKVRKTKLVDRKAPPPLDKFAENRLLGRSLNNERCIRAWQICYSPGAGEQGRGGEMYCMLSVGDGLDSWNGMMHGGIVALLMDSLTATMGSEYMRLEAEKSKTPRRKAVTRELRVWYRKAVRTPCLLLVRARVMGWEGEGRERGLRMKGSVEDGVGGVFAECESVLAGVVFEGRKVEAKL